MTRYNAITDGTEEVSETMETLIALQAGTIDLSGAPEEIKILPLGEVKSTKGTFLVDDASVDMILKSFRDRKIDLVVDYEHQTLLNVQAPASGWITELRKGTDAIIGKVQWTPKAKEYLKNREYRYLSPTIMVRKDRRVSAVSSVALTNSPAIDGMPAMCKDNGLTKGENTMDLKKLIEVLGLAEDATEEDILKAVKKAAEAAGAPETPPAAPPAEVVANSTILGLLDLPDTASTAEVSAKIVGLKNGDQQLALRVRQLEETAKERETNTLVQTALKDGKITAAQKEWARSYALKDTEGFKKFLELAGPAVPMGEIGLKDAPEGEKLDTNTMAILKNLGISAEDAKKYGNKNREPGAGKYHIEYPGSRRGKHEGMHDRGYQRVRLCSNRKESGRTCESWNGRSRF